VTVIDVAARVISCRVCDRRGYVYILDAEVPFRRPVRCPICDGTGRVRAG
jgi:hypothetical protein